MEPEKNPKEQNKCQYCGIELSWDIQTTCHNCVEKKHGPFQTYKYIKSLNWTPPQKGDIG